jgi:hypothetical protein
MTRYNVCELCCKAYQKALSPQKPTVCFQKDWHIPLYQTVINRDLLKPSEVFKSSDDNNKTEMNIDDNDDATD